MSISFDFSHTVYGELTTAFRNDQHINTKLLNTLSRKNVPIPSEYLDPSTGLLMMDPVYVTVLGSTYEYVTLSLNTSLPRTSDDPMYPPKVSPNHALKEEITKWRSMRLGQYLPQASTTTTTTSNNKRKLRFARDQDVPLKYHPSTTRNDVAVVFVDWVIDGIVILYPKPPPPLPLKPSTASPPLPRGNQQQRRPHTMEGLPMLLPPVNPWVQRYVRQPTTPKKLKENILSSASFKSLLGITHFSRKSWMVANKEQHERLVRKLRTEF
eukprot:PhF_6_TR25818/c0_g1_i2/m.36446